MSAEEETKDPWNGVHNVIGKKLRNKKKKLEKIKNKEQQLKSQQRKPTEEEAEMLDTKAEIQAQVDELNDMQ